MKSRRNHSDVAFSGFVCTTFDVDGNHTLPATILKARNKAGIQTTLYELGISHNRAKERKRRFDSFDVILVERTTQPVNGLFARPTPGREFRNQGVIVNRHFRICADAAVVPNARA